MFVEVILDSFVFPRTLTDESANFVFVDVESFPDTMERFVTTWPNQSLNVGRRDTPGVYFLWPREPVGTSYERGSR